MAIHTPAELGAAIRQRRLALGLEQLQLAQQVAVSRKWIVDIERGKPGAAIGLVLRTLRALGLSLDTVEDASRPGRNAPEIDLDAIIATARKPKS